MTSDPKVLRVSGVTVSLVTGEVTTHDPIDVVLDTPAPKYEPDDPLEIAYWQYDKHRRSRLDGGGGMAERDAFKAAAATMEAEKASAVCPRCEGDGEVSHGSCSVPDCEHADMCSTCNGTGTMPTAEQVADLRRSFEVAAADLGVTTMELAAYKERCAGGHPFDLQRIEVERDAALAEVERLKRELNDAHAHIRGLEAEARG